MDEEILVGGGADGRDEGWMEKIDPWERMRQAAKDEGWMDKVKFVSEASDIPVKLLRLLCYQQFLSFLFYSRLR